MNFAGGGHEVEIDKFNINEAWGHTTIRKDDAGIITATTCTASKQKPTAANVSSRNIKTAKIASGVSGVQTKNTRVGATRTRTKSK